MDLICYFNIFYRYGKKQLESMLEDEGITMQELIVLLVIAESPGILQSRLNAFVGQDKGNFSHFLKRLENRNLIYRQVSSEYPGHNQCFMTDEGQSKIPILKNIVADWEKLIFQNISREDQGSFFQTSQQISDNLFQKLDVRW